MWPYNFSYLLLFFTYFFIFRINGKTCLFRRCRGARDMLTWAIWEHLLRFFKTFGFLKTQSFSREPNLVSLLAVRQTDSILNRGLTCTWIFHWFAPFFFAWNIFSFNKTFKIKTMRIVLLVYFIAYIVLFINSYFNWKAKVLIVTV